MCRYSLIAAFILTAAGLQSTPAQNNERQGKGRLQGDSARALVLSVSQKEFLWKEPLLIQVRSTASDATGVLPSFPFSLGGKGFDFVLVNAPPTNPGKGAPPHRKRAKGSRNSLPPEEKGQDVRVRLYDLQEWYDFPEEGTFKIRAFLETAQVQLASNEIEITIRRPDKKGPEWGPVDRLHHLPWSNYITDAFCGDTFDLVKQWPKSRLARYAHYYNGLHSQHKQEYGKAVASFNTVVEQHPDFELAPAADFAIAECMAAQKQWQQAIRHLDAFQKRWRDRPYFAETVYPPLTAALREHCVTEGKRLPEGKAK
jgi:hypothetical protein